MQSPKRRDVSAIGPFFPGRPGLSESKTIDLVRPQDGQITAQIVDSGAEVVDLAVSAAKSAFEKSRKTPLHTRIQWLKNASEALRASVPEIAALVCEDVGKPIKAATFETGRGCDFLEACAATATQIGGEVLALDGALAGTGLTGITRRVPYGVVAGITPFNAPVNLLLQKVAPAIAMGNTIVIKPSLPGSRTAVRLAELFMKAGWPEGLFNVVTGDRDAAISLAAHPDVRAVSFTGGTAAGNDIARATGARKFLAELGSNAANIVMADGNLGLAAARIASAGFEASGQQCISAQRVLVERRALEAFLPLFIEATKTLKIGPATDPSTDVGPMVHAGAADRVMAMVKDAIDRGASCALEPQRNGATVSPGILVDVPRTAKLWKEEAFGPVVVVVPFDTVDEALGLANDSEFGLQGAIFTSNLATMLRFADEMEVGSLWVNEASRFRLDMHPFGGVKQSGVGREGVRYAMEELSQIKFIGIRPGN